MREDTILLAEHDSNNGSNTRNYKHAKTSSSRFICWHWERRGGTTNHNWLSNILMLSSMLIASNAVPMHTLLPSPFSRVSELNIDKDVWKFKCCIWITNHILSIVCMDASVACLCFSPQTKGDQCCEVQMTALLGKGSHVWMLQSHAVASNEGINATASNKGGSMLQHQTKFKWRHCWDRGHLYGCFSCML